MVFGTCDWFPYMSISVVFPRWLGSSDLTLHMYDWSLCWDPYICCYVSSLAHKSFHLALDFTVLRAANESEICLMSVVTFSPLYNLFSCMIFPDKSQKFSFIIVLHPELGSVRWFHLIKSTYQRVGNICSCYFSVLF